MHVSPIGQALLRLDQATDPDRLRGQVSALTLDNTGNLWCAADPLEGILRLQRQDTAGQSTTRPAWGAPISVDLAGMYELPNPGETLDLAGMDWGGDRVWFVGSQAGARLGPDPDLTEAANSERLTRVEPVLKRCLLGYARVSADRLPGPRDLAMLPILEDGNALTRALTEDSHLGAFAAPGRVAATEGGLRIRGLAVHAGRIWLGLGAPVLGQFAVLLQIEPRDQRRGFLELPPIGLGGRPYRKHLVDLGGLAIQDLHWRGDALLILAGPAPGQSGASALFRLRGVAGMADDSLTLSTDHRLEPIQTLPVSPEGGQHRALACFDGLGQPGVLVAYGNRVPEGRGGDDGLLADVFPLAGT